MKKLLSLFLVFFVLQTVTAQTLLPTVVKHSGVDYVRLAQIDTVLKQYTDKNWLAGAVVIVVKHNQVAYYKGHGYSNISSKKPMQANAIFRIMSQTKAITSLAIMQLFERGKLGLDQNISDFMPEFKNPKVIQSFNPTDSSFTSTAA